MSEMGRAFHIATDMVARLDPELIGIVLLSLRVSLATSAFLSISAANVHETGMAPRACRTASSSTATIATWCGVGRGPASRERQFSVRIRWTMHRQK